MYEAPAHAMYVMGPHVKTEDGVTALNEACRRAVAAELQARIDALVTILIGTDGVGQGGLSTAIEHLRGRLNEVTSA